MEPGLPVANEAGTVHGNVVQAGSIDQVVLQAPRSPVEWAKASGISNLPARNPRFTGRVDLLAELTRSVGPVVLHGLGGVGKSQVALEHAHRGEYTMRWWVRAENENTLTADLVALADALGLDVTHERVVARLLVELGRHDDWLLVLDNAEDPDLVARIPANGHVVITTRSRRLPGTVLEVAEMAQDEAVALLDDGPDADELAEVLGRLPLALAQARSYVDVHGCSFRRYLALYRRASEELLKIGPEPVGYPHTVATTWLLHFRELSKPAVFWLELTAFLAPDAIPLGLMLAALGVELVARERAIGELVAASLLTRIDDDTVRVHRLVQTVTRSRMTAKKQAIRLSEAIAILFTALPKSPALPENWPLMATIAPHALAAGMRMKTTSRDAGNAGMLLNLLGMNLRSRGENTAALELFERSLSLINGAEDRERLARATIWLEIAFVRSALNDVPAMVDAATRGWGIATGVLGEHHPELAVTLAQIAGLLVQHGMYDQALPLLEAALATKLAHGAEPDVGLAWIHHYLAMLAAGKGRHAEALDHHRLAVEIVEAQLGPDNSQLATMRTMYAVEALEAGQQELARALVLRALPVLRAKIGPEHHNTLLAEQLLAELG